MLVAFIIDENFIIDLTKMIKENTLQSEYACAN